MTTTNRTARELMSQPVLLLEPESTVAIAREGMVRNHIHAIPVHSRHGGLLGLVSASDLLAAADDSEHISAIMRQNLRTVGPDMPATEVAALMVEEKLHHVVVVDNDKLTGIISAFDLLPDVR